MKLLLSIFGFIFLQSAASQQVDPNFCRDENVTTGVLPHPELGLCNYFVVCVFSNPYVQVCPDNHIFVPTLGSNPPEGYCQPGYVETCQLTTQQPTTFPTTTTSTTATQTPTPPPPTPITTTTQSPHPPPEVPKDICKGIIMRRIPYPNNCYWYILCVAQIPHIGTCESHQIFHQEWHVCIRGNRDTCRPCLFC